jgi:hypothetical protein
MSGKHLSCVWCGTDGLSLVSDTAGDISRRTRSTTHIGNSGETRYATVKEQEVCLHEGEDEAGSPPIQESKRPPAWCMQCHQKGRSVCKDETLSMEELSSTRLVVGILPQQRGEEEQGVILAVPPGWCARVLCLLTNDRNRASGASWGRRAVITVRSAGVDHHAPGEKASSRREPSACPGRRSLWTTTMGGSLARAHPPGCGLARRT